MKKGTVIYEQSSWLFLTHCATFLLNSEYDSLHSFCKKNENELTATIISLVWRRWVCNLILNCVSTMSHGPFSTWHSAVKFPFILKTIFLTFPNTSGNFLFEIRIPVSPFFLWMQITWVWVYLCINESGSFTSNMSRLHSLKKILS